MNSEPDFWITINPRHENAVWGDTPGCFGDKTEMVKFLKMNSWATAVPVWGAPPAVKESLTPAPACQFPACEDGTHPCAKHAPKACLRCKSSVTIWKGWELCDTCGFRHHESGLWPDGAAPTTEKGVGE